MSLIQDKQLCYINSNNRLTGTSSDFTVNLAFDANMEYDRCAVLQVSIPQSYYLIELGQNTFTLIEGNKQATVTLAAGNYNRRSLSTVLTSILTSSSPNSWIYSVTYPNVATQVDTGFYTYTVSGNTSQPSFVFSQFCYDALGFSENSTNNFVSNTLISTNVTKLVPADQLFLHSDICSNKNDDVIQDIYASGAVTYSSILFQNFDVESYSKTFISNKNNAYRFYLTDSNNLAINLNGQNMVITLLLYKKNSIWNMLNGFLKYMLLKN